jgi:Predicted membrane protein (DUF2232).
MAGVVAVWAGSRDEDNMNNKVLIAVGGGAVGALLAVAAFSGIPGGVFLAYFAPLPLMLVGLSHGVGALGLAATAGIVVCLATGGVAGAAVYAALGALPSWLTVQSALRRETNRETGQVDWRPIGRTIAQLSLVVAFTMVMLAAGSAEGEPIAATVREQLLASFNASLPEIDPEILATLVDNVAPFFLGFSAGLWLLMIAVNAILAENFAAARNWAIRPRPKWSAFALPNWFAWPLVISAVIGLIPGGDAQFIARNLVMVFAAGYLFQGLATIHTISRGLSGRIALLGGVYVSLFVFSLVAAPLVAGLGMIDQWAEIRRRRANSRGA